MENKKTSIDEKQAKAKKNTGLGMVFRWYGIFVIFALVGGIYALSYISLNLIIKNQLEDILSKANGASVEIGSINFSLDPIGLKVNNLSIANSINLERNQIEISKISLVLSLYHLIEKKFVINDITFSNIATNVKRKNPAKLFKSQQEEDKESTTSKLKKKASDTFNKALVTSNLSYDAELDKLQKMLPKAEQDIKQAKKNLGSIKSYNEYEQQVNNIFSNKLDNLDDLKNIQNKIEVFNKELDRDKKIYNANSKVIKNAITQLDKQIAVAKSALQNDIKKLMRKYSGTSGLVNISKLLIDKSLLDKIAKLKSSYNTYLEIKQEYFPDKPKTAEKKAPKRSLGKNVKFKQHDPQPKFNIKRIYFSGEIARHGKSQEGSKELNDNISKLAKGNAYVLINNVNFEHKAYRKIPKLKVEYTTLNDSNFSMDGSFDYSNLDIPKNIIKVHLNKYRIKDWQWLNADKYRLLLQDANSNLKGAITFQNLDKINAQFTQYFTRTKFVDSVILQERKEYANDIYKYLYKALQPVQQFTVDYKFTGSLGNPNLQVDTNLNKIVEKNMGKLYSDKIKDEKQKLETQVQKEFDKKLASIFKNEEEFTNAKNLVQDLNSFDKIQQRLDTEFTKKRKELEAKIKDKKSKELDKKAKELERELKNKLKKLF